MTDRTCPDPATLEALLDDALPAARQAALAEHLERCEACRGRLDRLAMPTQFLAADGAVEPIPPPGSGFAPPRALIEAWQRQVAPPGATSRPFDPAAAIRGRLEPAQEPGEIGRLGPFRVLRVLGQGGMGVVVLAFDPTLRRPVAIKLMQPDLAAHPEARERFLREARSAAAVRHESVVTIHAVENDGDRPYLVMEYVPGRSLQHRLDAEGPLATEEVARLGAQIADGLASAHAQGLVHRDVKPANILIDERTGQAKLCDFGLARAGDDPSLTRVGFIAGTPEYLAPEQAWGHPLDHRTDLYSLGATLYAASTGRPPLTAPSTLGLLRKLGRVSPPSVRALAPQTDARLARLIGQMLATNPAGRPHSAREVAEALRALPGSRPRRRPGWQTAAAAALCAAGLLGAWLASGPRREAQEAPSAPIPASVIPEPEPSASGPFVLDGGRRFATLAGAVAAAQGDAVIEVATPGPHETTPIDLGSRALTIRAAEGVTPTLVLAPRPGGTWEPGLVSGAALTLEGLVLRSSVRPEAPRFASPRSFSVIVVRGGPLRATRCRFEVGTHSACLAVLEGSGEIRDCHFAAADGVGLCWAPASGRSMLVEQALFTAHTAVAVQFDEAGSGPDRATIQLDRATIRAGGAVRILNTTGFTAPPRLFVRVRVERSILDATRILTIVRSPAAGRGPGEFQVGAVMRQLRKHLSWQGRANLYPDAAAWLAYSTRGLSSDQPFAGPDNLSDWGRLWGRDEVDSRQLALEFRGPRDSADPADHALATPAGTSGEPDTEPPGADVRRIGPRPLADASVTARSGSR